MNVMKLIDIFMDRVEEYEKKREKEENPVLKEFYGVRINELRMCILDVTDWATDEIVKGAKK